MVIQFFLYFKNTIEKISALTANYQNLNQSNKGIRSIQLNSFFKSLRIIFYSQFQLTHRIITITADKIRRGTLGKVNLRCKIFNRFIVLVDSFITYTSVMQVLQILRLRFQGHCVIFNRLMIHAQSDVAISSVSITFGML